MNKQEIFGIVAFGAAAVLLISSLFSSEEPAKKKSRKPIKVPPKMDCESVLEKPPTDEDSKEEATKE